MFQSDQAGSRLLFGGSETAGRLSRRGAADSSLAGTGSRKFAMLKRFFPDQHPHAGRDIGRLVDSRVLAPEPDELAEGIRGPTDRCGSPRRFPGLLHSDLTMRANPAWGRTGKSGNTANCSASIRSTTQPVVNAS